METDLQFAWEILEDVCSPFFIAFIRVVSLLKLGEELSEDRGSCFFSILLDRDRVSFQPEDLGTGWFLPSPVGAGDVLAELAAGRRPG